MLLCMNNIKSVAAFSSFDGHLTSTASCMSSSRNMAGELWAHNSSLWCRLLKRCCSTARVFYIVLVQIVIQMVNCCLVLLYKGRKPTAIHTLKRLFHRGFLFCFLFCGSPTPLLQWDQRELREMLCIHNHWSLMFPYLQVKYLNVRFERELSEQSAHLEDEQKRQISLIKQVKQLTIYLFILAMFISPFHTRLVL